MVKNFRYFSSSTLDIDAYHLEQNGYGLFAIIKSSQKEDSYSKNFLFQKCKEFSIGKVICIGGAKKTENKSEPIEPTFFEEIQNTLWTKDFEIYFKLEFKDVLNPGLFIDQNENRKFLYDQIQKKINKTPECTSERLLNLFSYTGSFSLVAQKAGLLNTVSVDVSKRYLSWEKESFQKTFLNDTQNRNARLICEDARVFLKKNIKRKEKYNWIIIDPPTFSRSQGRVFKVQHELSYLLKDSLAVAATNSWVLVSCNDTQWSRDEFNKKISSTIAESWTGKYKLISGVTDPSFPKSHPLKSIFIHLY